jgi:CheY-like chemotaxis protein
MKTPQDTFPYPQNPDSSLLQRSNMKIVILEDNQDRRAAMLDCVRDRFHRYETVFFDDAKEMQVYLDANLASALIISLDHDLELKSRPDGGMVDPGTGREVADFLARQPPTCPIIIATTNSAAGDGMEFVLRDASWQIHRVHPWGDLAWIAGSWFRTLRNAIVGSAKRRRPENGTGVADDVQRTLDRQ